MKIDLTGQDDRVRQPLARTESQAAQVLAHILDEHEATTLAHLSGLCGENFSQLTRTLVEQRHALGRSDIHLVLRRGKQDAARGEVTLVMELKLGDLLSSDQVAREAFHPDYLVTVTLEGPPARSAAAATTHHITWDDVLSWYGDHPLTPPLRTSVARIASGARVAARLRLQDELGRARARIRGVAWDEAVRARAGDVHGVTLDVEGPADLYAELEVGKDGDVQSTVMLTVSFVDGHGRTGFFPEALHKCVWTHPGVRDSLTRAKGGSRWVSRGTNLANPDSKKSDPERIRLRRAGIPLSSLRGFDMGSWVGYGERLAAGTDQHGTADLAALVDDTVAVLKRAKRAAVAHLNSKCGCSEAGRAF